ncbi:odorant-binding protein [Culex quinquefasciatus]|uniref:Odorant-binding protein n=1 Tax=Culex quinquefasciatus TaxID=7176 RepID=B0XC63_CULQU|nr:odorant-binding protein [Culex quinquefasciatus]|eukprot:XP_001867235.1 odorant-binding protein [Culex quinquefasciatus]
MKCDSWATLLLTVLIWYAKFCGHDCVDILEEAKKGVFPNEKNFKCYVSCLLDMMQATKRGKISYEKSLKQIDTLLPDDFKPDFRNGLEACKDVAQGVKDHCESAYVLLNCFYQNNPKFIFP